MRLSLILILSLICLASGVDAQKRNAKKRFVPKSAAVHKPLKALGPAVVIDERLAVLRAAPSLFARPVRRMRRGRALSILDSRESDGVTFYRVAASRRTSGWMQREALAARNLRADENRLLGLVQASEGFDQIERMRIYLENYAASPLRPAMLLLFGDLLEQAAQKMSTEAARRLDRREMAATGAPLHSFFLNYASLDRYQRLGIVFWFNPHTRRLHYNGAVWREIAAKYPRTGEAAEAQKRLESLQEKIAATK